MKFYAKIGASFVTRTGYNKHPMTLAKFDTETEALEHAQFMRTFVPCSGAITVVQAAA